MEQCLEKFKKQQRDLFEKTPRYFDKKGNPLELLEWARLFEDRDYRIVRQEEVGKYLVSTVWVGLNMSYWAHMPILIFETMIFSRDDEDIEDPICGYQQRYSTEEQAIEGHEKAVKIAKGEILLENEFMIARRDPTERDAVRFQYWLNNESNELFQFTGKWTSVTNEYLKLKEIN